MNTVDIDVDILEQSFSFLYFDFLNGFLTLIILALIT